MEDNDNRRIVNVTLEAKALSEPTFIIKVGGKYYVTLALWEYDPGASHISHEQRQGVAEIERLHGQERGKGVQPDTVQVPPGKICTAMSTRPPQNSQ